MSSWCGVDLLKARMMKLVYVLLPVFLLLPAVLAGECKDRRQTSTTSSNSAISYTSPPMLPGSLSTSVNFPINSLVIPMDGKQMLGKDDCGETDNFHLEAYGCIIKAIHSGIPVHWIVESGKSHNDADILNLDVSDITTLIGSCVPGSTRISGEVNIGGGPFVIEEAYASAFLALPCNNNMRILQANEPFSAPVRVVLDTKPFVGVSNAGGDHFLIMDSADLASISDSTCLSIVTEPHFNAQSEHVTAAMEFLRSGGNFLAQCEALEKYEEQGLFLTTGIKKAKEKGTLTYPNADALYAQFHNNLESDPGGSVTDWELTPGATLKPNTFSAAEAGSIFAAMAGRVENTDDEFFGGMMHYLGGHEWEIDDSLEEDNGIRLYMNAVLTPAKRPAACGFGLSGDLEVEVRDLMDAVSLSSLLTYEVEVSNLGSVAITGDLDIQLDPTVTFVSVDPSGSCSMMPPINCPNIIVDPGDSVVITVAVEPNAVGTIGISAEVTSAMDTDTSNNFDCEPTNVCDDELLGTIDKVLTAPVDGNLGVNTDEVLSYTVQFTNDNTAVATDIVIEDVFLGGEVINANTAAGEFDIQTNVWKIPGVAAGATASLFLDTLLTTETPGDSITNTACTTQANQFISSSICGSHSTIVVPSFIDKTVTPNEIRETDVWDNRVVIRNEETVANTYDFQDLLPAGVGLVGNLEATVYNVREIIVTEDFLTPSIITPIRNATATQLFSGPPEDLNASSDVTFTASSFDVGANIPLDLQGQLFQSVSVELAYSRNALSDTLLSIELEQLGYEDINFGTIGPETDIMVQSFSGSIEVPIERTPTQFPSVRLVLKGSDSGSGSITFNSIEVTYTLLNPVSTFSSGTTSLNSLAILPTQVAIIEYQTTFTNFNVGVTQNTAVASPISTIPKRQLIATADINAVSDLQVTKSANTISATTGDFVTYTVTLETSSRSLAGVSLTDAFDNAAFQEGAIIAHQLTTGTPGTIMGPTGTPSSCTSATATNFGICESGDSGMLDTGEITYANGEVEIGSSTGVFTYSFSFASMTVENAVLTLEYRRNQTFSTGSIRIDMNDDQIIEIPALPRIEDDDYTRVEITDLDSTLSENPNFVIEIFQNIPNDEGWLRIRNVELNFLNISTITSPIPVFPMFLSGMNLAPYTRYVVEYTMVVIGGSDDSPGVNTVTASSSDTESSNATTSVEIQSNIVASFLSCPISFVEAQFLSFEFVYENIATVSHSDVTLYAVFADPALFDSVFCILTDVSLSMDSVVATSNPIGTGIVASTISLDPGDFITCSMTVEVSSGFSGTFDLAIAAGSSSQTKPSDILCNVPELVAADDNVETIQDQPLIIPITDNDEIFDVQTLTVESDPLLLNGDLFLNSPYFGNVYYVPTSGFTGIASFNYTICSENSFSCASADVEINVIPLVNAINDNSIVIPDTNVTILVAMNDVGPIDITSLRIDSQPGRPGNIVYIDPVTDGVLFYWGNALRTNGATDTFTYEICSNPLSLYPRCSGSALNDNCDVAIVTVTLNPCDSISVSHVFDCDGTNSRATLVITGATLPITQVDWSDSSSNQLFRSPLTEDSYTVELEDSNNCNAIYSFNVVYGEVEPNVSTDDGFVCAASTTLFVQYVDNVACSLSDLELSVMWGDGENSSHFPDADSVLFVGGNFTATHQYRDLGVYTVTYTLSDNGNVRSSSTTTIIVDEFSGILIQPPPLSNLMMYREVTVGWDIRPGGAIAAGIPIINGMIEKVDQPLMGTVTPLFTDYRAELDSVVVIPHHLYPGMYNISVSTPDFCSFFPSITVEVYGNQVEYCHLRPEDQYTPCTNQI